MCNVKGAQMTYEAVIYDVRDQLSEDPASTLGEFQSREDAAEAIWKHLDRFPEQRRFIVKTEVLIVQ